MRLDRKLQCYVAWLVLAVGLTACALDSQQKAVRAGLISVDATRDGFLAWDKAHQQQLVDQAATAADSDKALTAYRANRAVLVQAFVAVYHALAVAAITPSQENFGTYLIELKDLYQAIRDLTGHDPVK